MKRITNSLIANILFLVLSLMLGYSTYGLVRHFLILRSEDSEAKKKIEGLIIQKQELEIRLAELQTPEAVEREAKERFNFKNQGEEVAVVVPSLRVATSNDSRGLSMFLKKLWLNFRLLSGF